MKHFVTIYVLIALAAIAFGTCFMGYEQMRANRGFFIDPQAIAMPEPTPVPRPMQTPPAHTL